VATRVDALYETDPFTGAPPTVSLNVPVLIVEAFMLSLNVTVTGVVTATPCDPLAGVEEVTVGGVVSAGGTVVNAAENSDASGLSAASVIPIVATRVYVTPA
jgi:hypothetical protein